MGEARGHLTQRGEPLAKPLLLAHSLEGRQVAKDDRRPANLALGIPHRSQRETDGALQLAANAFQNEFRAGQRGPPIEGLQQQTRDRRLEVKNFFARLSEGVARLALRTSENALGTWIEHHHIALVVDRDDPGTHRGENPLCCIGMGRHTPLSARFRMRLTSILCRDEVVLTVLLEPAFQLEALDGAGNGLSGGSDHVGDLLVGEHLGPTANRLARLFPGQANQ